MRLHADYGVERIEPHGLELSDRSTETLAIAEDDPLSAEADARWRIELARRDWRDADRDGDAADCDAGAFAADRPARRL